ncbi:hypothetical protein C3489_17700 [Streptomyces sp. Ru71]|uniref:hypothetical protein n=1 Tax=Streptomyces sp. Ru71 TaxID=2080746 RepID=UPI000CDD3F50|nr:hypothetical protein [Streptomyces sp. Ru71]POX52532.1 hypothetical protein C3489_17700 [Streptomyces sp. Ru71]
MPFFSPRGRTPRLTPELDDADLGKLLKRLQSATRLSMAGGTEICVAQMAQVLEPDDLSADRRAHRLSVLAEFLSDSHLPSAWARREPRNPRALLLQAWSELERGRGTGRMSDAAAAWKSCLLAAELDPADPSPWVVMLGIARLERYAEREVFAVWNEIVARDRWNREAYLSMLAYLSPQEAGSLGQVLEFVGTLRTRMPANAPCASVELAADIMQYHSALARGGAEALLARNHWNGSRVSQFLDRALVTWPSPAFFSHAAAIADLNLLAYALNAAGGPRETAPVFDAIGGRVTSRPWNADGDPVAAFEAAHNKAR